MSMYPMNNLITQTIYLYKAEINRDDLISDWYDESTHESTHK